MTAFGFYEAQTLETFRNKHSLSLGRNHMHLQTMQEQIESWQTSQRLSTTHLNIRQSLTTYQEISTNFTIVHETQASFCIFTSSVTISAILVQKVSRKFTGSVLMKCVSRHRSWWIFKWYLLYLSHSQTRTHTRARTHTHIFHEPVVHSLLPWVLKKSAPDWILLFGFRAVANYWLRTHHRHLDISVMEPTTMAFDRHCPPWSCRRGHDSAVIHDS